MALRFYNTLTQKVEEFSTLHAKEVRMYTCGPTVYNYVHIGNLRTFTFQDILRRWLIERGYKMNHVMNITDVEDKIIRNSMAQGKTIQEYTETYTQAFIEDTRTLRLQGPERLVKATEHITEMVSDIQRLSENGFTYVSEGSVYYRISKFHDYGKLSHMDFQGVQAGARVDVDEYDKDNARDFVLWKARKDNEPCWETPLGAGRPGWHIECSSMAMKYLGETLDIHAGGIDLTFPHHENEIAQSEAITGKPFARFWLHSEHLTMDMQKMSKSLGNIYTLRDILAMGYAPETLRYVLASSHYRSKLNFTLDSLQAGKAAIDRLRSFKLRLETAKFAAGENAESTERARKARKAFEDAMDDDLKTTEAVAAVFEYLREMNTVMDAGSFLAGNVAGANEVLALFDRIFAVLEPTPTSGGMSDADIEARIAERNAAKKARNFQLGDQIRKDLLEAGIVLEDTKDGVRWKRK